VPLYALTVLEHDASVTTGEYMPPGGEWLQVADRFTHEGRSLRVTEIAPSDDPYDERLVCIVG
jgi:hypothetical protein